MVESKQEISLSEKEIQIFTTLKEFMKEADLKTTIRVAGGWVRDKLLGLESDDIDLALDDMFGEDFAQKICDWLNDKAAKEGQEVKKQKFGVIKANSEAAKHLETATFNLHGVSLDLVNLRSEEYSADSRVPTMKIGSPEEDAYRRDLTFNALFYNINENKIEDFTGKGLDDLRNKVCRTPLEPKTTFNDDPLRVLRVIRFANRFDATIVPEIMDAAKQEDVRQSFFVKLSFERIGVELDKMCGGNNPHLAMQHLYEINIMPLLYKFPPEAQELQKQNVVDELLQRSVGLCDILGQEFMKERENAGHLKDLLGIDLTKTNLNLNDFQMRAFYVGLLKNFWEIQLPLGKKKVMTSVVEYIMLNSLKRSNDVQKFVYQTCKHVPSMIDFTNENFVVDIKQEDFRLKLGRFIRTAGHFWPSIVLLAYAQEVTQNHEDRTKLAEKYSTFNKIVEEANLNEVHKMQPLINGNDICTMYEIKKGKIVGPLLDEVLSFQFVNPLSPLKDVELYMQSKKDEFLMKHSH